MMAHIAQWLMQGVTLSPVEPSEGMELAKHGVVNTGLVFFVAAILVTAVFGRFFCGWGCHLIALQDLSRWILIKMGIRPRPLRSRLLGMVPLLAFIYMFLWPAIYKVSVGQASGPITSSFITADFWATFPGLTVALLTFFTCGVAVVFVLGSKGYCTYGCPYGAAFALADRLAPVRVRVTDACRGCATCTSVCTSNVRVHEEVGHHGMVVDPGCMKCLDCVANCPNEALYVGTGPPAMARRGERSGSGWLSPSEEILAGLVFGLGFFAFRGLYGIVPFLFSLGLAAILAGLVVVLWRVIRDDDAWLGPIRLESEGRLRGSGRIFSIAMVVILAGWVQSAFVQGLTRHTEHLFESTAELRGDALEINRPRVPLTAQDRRLVSRARRSLERLDAWSPIGVPGTQLRMAWMAFLAGDSAEARIRIDGAVMERPADPLTHLLAGRLLVDDGRWEAAEDAYARVVELDSSIPAGHLGLGTVIGQTGRYQEALDTFSRGLISIPTSVALRYNVGLSLALTGDLDGAIDEFMRVLQDDPEYLPARENLAGVLAGAGRFEEAVVVFEDAVVRSPSDAQLRIMAARACLGAGRRTRAEEHIEAAIALDSSLAPARALLD